MLQFVYFLLGVSRYGKTYIPRPFWVTLISSDLCELL